MTRKIAVLTFVLCLVLPGLAQMDNDDRERGQFGIYGEYFRFQGIKANLGGIGGRLSINVTDNFALEGELGYLFQRAFFEEFNTGIPTQVQLNRSRVRVLHGLFGPKLQFSGAARPFVTLKGGFLNTEFSDDSPGATFRSQIDLFRRSDAKGVLYPGAGIEGFLGPIGLRFDIGDEIFFAGRRAHHNLRITLGPHIRF